MSDLTYHTARVLAHSPAFQFVLEEFVKLLQQGRADTELPFWNGNSVVYVLDGDRCVAASVYFTVPEKAAAWVPLTAVHESYRRRGIYTRMARIVEDDLKKKGIVVLYSAVALDNTAIIESGARIGRVGQLLRTKKVLT